MLFCPEVTQNAFEQELQKVLICSISRSLREMPEEWKKKNVFSWGVEGKGWCGWGLVSLFLLGLQLPSVAGP